MNNKKARKLERQRTVAPSQFYDLGLSPNYIVMIAMLFARLYQISSWVVLIMSSVHRYMPQTSKIRQFTPYINFRTVMPPSARWSQFENGHGSRHIDDDAPFSLWVAQKGIFRKTTAEENRWILDQYQSPEFYSRADRIFIYTPNPPTPVPLTLGCVPVVFLPVHDMTAHFDEMPWPKPVCFNPNVPDPMGFRIGKWALPTQAQWETVATFLCSKFPIKTITFIDCYLQVEIETDGRTYLTSGLPGYVAGKTTVYYQQEAPLWPSFKRTRMDRMSDPSLVNEKLRPQDTTSYLALGSMCPGTRITGLMVDPKNPKSRLASASSTAGMVVHHTTTGERRLIVSLQAFAQSMKGGLYEVFHPSQYGEEIGTIETFNRWMDIAFVRLRESVKFNNKTYFEAHPPKKILRYRELRAGMWFAADSMSTGLMSLMLEGLKSQPLAREPPDGSQNFRGWSHEGVYHTIGPVGGACSRGAAGAPIVSDDPSGSGGVAGFFKAYEGGRVFAPILDPLLAGGVSEAVCRCIIPGCR